MILRSHGGDNDDDASDDDGVSVDGLDFVIVVPPARLLRVLVASLDVE